MKKFCFKKICICSECGKKLGFLEGYRHPVDGKKKCVCGKCWDKIEKSEKKYCNFIFNSLTRTGTGPICFVLINAAPTYEQKIYDKLSKLPEIIELYPLLGWYDLIVKIEAKDSDELGSRVINKIRTIEGIKNTRTLTGAFSLT